ncbi:AraC family transcriptional regulator [Kaistia dalseonensis]|uniref:AraC-like DNA-binding protein n=1 Tax=Kaistia dalseonensis TaxID=410840 RepID=A0ABU0HBH4_9HYPH|nr:AraC family transcriptional regulator [Kaistia dalseonensis]MCX5497033.1 AraC family transcriptional regulator [Kaistia dalseonensis]MDQ0439659.1 AraC-like DNA-binding protein [Kaistia dalseonensis]
MDQMNELRGLIARHCQVPRVETPIPRVTLMRSGNMTMPSRVLYEPLFCIVAQGAKRVIVGDNVLIYDAAKYLVVSVDLPASGEIIDASPEEPYLAFSLRLDRAMLAAMLLELAEIEDDGAPVAGMAVSAVDADLLDPVIRMLKLLDRPRDLPVLGPMLEREILYRLLCGAQGRMLRQIALSDSRLSCISRVIDWIKHNYAEAARVEMLAEIAGMSASSFHRHFKAVTSMSPLQFQKQIRLQEARRLLLARPADAGSIGFAVGYESQSQFTREYNRLFGAPPARDAARLRELSITDPQRMAEPV